MTRCFLFPVLSCFFLITMAHAKNMIQGEVVLHLNQINAYHMNGSPAPMKDTSCQRRYHALLSKTIKITYQINPITLFEIAKSEINNTNTVLHPMGIARNYSFMSDGVSKDLYPVTRIIFTLDKTMDPQSARGFLLLEKNSQYNCMISATHF